MIYFRHNAFLAAIAELKQEIRKMGSSITQQITDATAAIQADLATMTTGVASVAAEVTTLQALLPFIAQFAGLVGAETAVALDSRIPQMSIAQVMKAYGTK
jgi:enamine deaminase RidA (YjgF/YER057c/UK114 family)